MSLVKLNPSLPQGKNYHSLSKTKNDDELLVDLGYMFITSKKKRYHGVR